MAHNHAGDQRWNGNEAVAVGSKNLNEGRAFELVAAATTKQIFGPRVRIWALVHRLGDAKALAARVLVQNSMNGTFSLKLTIQLINRNSLYTEAGRRSIPIERRMAA